MPGQLAFVFDEDPGLPTVETSAPRAQVTPPPGSPFMLVFVRHPRARRYVLRVRPDATVRVTVPRWGSRKEAAAFAERERPWIEKQLRRIRVDEIRQVLPDAGSDRPSLQGRQLTGRELLDQAARHLVPRLKQLARIHGLTVNRVSIRNQRSRWGSCSRGGHICLNWRLMTMPDWVRDYVLIHELMHLKRMDHSPRFWKLVERACPDYQRARRYLREQSVLLVSNSPGLT
jgi:predicted metal-dependent hydrolase